MSGYISYGLGTSQYHFIHIHYKIVVPLQILFIPTYDHLDQTYDEKAIKVNFNYIICFYAPPSSYSLPKAPFSYYSFMDIFLSRLELLNM